MAKRICTLILIVSLVTFIGCQQPNSGNSRKISPRTQPSLGTSNQVNITQAGEIDIVEDVESHRQAYKQTLEMLVKYYEETGNNTKLNWAQKELNALNVMTQYSYIIPVVTAGEYRARIKATSGSYSGVAEKRFNVTWKR